MTCRRKCPSAECKKAHRRINIYRSYVDKNFESLNKEFEFLGDLGKDEDQLLMEEYIIGRKYIKIILKKRKLAMATKENKKVLNKEQKAGLLSSMAAKLKNGIPKSILEYVEHRRSALRRANNVPANS